MALRLMSEMAQGCRRSELEPEYPTRVKVGDRDIALYLVEGSVFATDNICTHAFASCPTATSKASRSSARCTRGSFDVRTGEAEGSALRRADRRLPVPDRER